MTETAVFGGGCFWCTEAVFLMLKGVTAVEPGYAGGHTEQPSYAAVCGGATGHAEVIRVTYDPKVISYRDLLTVFFASHDPTTLNRQGNDVGTQYRSIILTTTAKQQQEARVFLDELNAAHEEGDPIVTEVAPLRGFFEAEQEHKDYYARNATAGYCQVVINPKLQKVQKEFAALVKENG